MPLPKGGQLPSAAGLCTVLPAVVKGAVGFCFGELAPEQHSQQKRTHPEHVCTYIHRRVVTQRMRIAYRICPRMFFLANCFGDGLARLRALDGALEATYGTRVSLQKLEFHRFRVSGELRLQDSGISLLGKTSAIAQVGTKINTHSARARRRLHR